MSYQPKSQIYIEQLKQAKLIDSEVNKKWEQNELSFIKYIENSENRIKELKNKMEEIDEQKREIIYKLRNIMEDENNHIGNLFCNQLKDNKAKEYEKEIENYNKLIKDKIYEQYSELIKKEINTINENIKNLRKIEKKNEKVEDEAIEKGRKEILKQCIDTIEYNEMTVKYIEELKGRKNEIEKKYKETNY